MSSTNTGLVNMAKCGKEITTYCTNKKVPYTEAGFRLFVGEFVVAYSFLVTGLYEWLAYTFNMSIGRLRTMNAWRCASANAFDNAWTIIAGSYYLFKYLGQPTITNWLDENYPKVCSCSEYMRAFLNDFGSNDSINYVFTSCSEKS